MPRPRVLDDTKRREVCALITAGCSLSTAARYVGCSTVTVRREAMRNSEFCDQLRQAEMMCQVSPLRAMRRAAETHWRAAAWLLERVEPDRFTKHKPNFLAPEVVQEFLDHLTKMIVEEVRSEDDRDRVCHALAKLDYEVRRNAHALMQPFRSTKERSNRRRASLPALEDADAERP